MASQGVGLLWPQHPLFGLQRTLVERLGLFVLALVPVEHCQVIDSAQRVRCSGPSTRSQIVSSLFRSGSASLYWPR